MALEHHHEGSRDKRVHSNELDAGVSLAPTADGFRIKSTGGVREGDTLLVSYKTASGEWQRVAVEYQDEPKGMFVFTGDRPTSIYVVKKHDVERAERLPDVPRTVYQSRRHESSSTTSSSSSMDPFDPANLFNPLNMWSPFNPIGFLNQFHHDSGGGSTSAVEEPRHHQQPDVDLNGATLPPGVPQQEANPFDKKDLDLPGAGGFGAEPENKEGGFGDLGGGKDDGFGGGGPAHESDSGFASSGTSTEPSAYP